MTVAAKSAWRRWCAVLLLAAVLPVSCMSERRPPDDFSQPIAVTALSVPPVAVTAPHLGAFRLDGIWQMTSRNTAFGSYSTLQRLQEGLFLAISDRGYSLTFAPPGYPMEPMRATDLIPSSLRQKANRDAESSAYDPATGRVWIGWEGANAISRMTPDLAFEAIVRPSAMRRWDTNGGAETMLRLPDGRFIVIAEGFAGLFEGREHRALLFPGDPTEGAWPATFRFSGAADFSPTDITQLPDGRVLILMRRAVWPLPLRFAGRIMIADPAAIRAGGVWRARTVADLSSSLPVDNFEGIVAEPQRDGRIAVWLISDDNQAATQRTLLWKMTVDPKRLR